jgi:hypothetical protein
MSLLEYATSLYPNSFDTRKTVLFPLPVMQLEEQWCDLIRRESLAGLAWSCSR